MTRCGQRRERGAVTMIVVLVLLTVVAASMLILSGMVQSSVNDSVLEDDSIAALFLAESGLESATRAYATSETCTAAGVGAGTYAFGRGTFTTAAVSGAGTACTLQSTGVIGNVTRVIVRTVDYNLIANGDFETPGTCPPSGWALTTTSARSCATINGNTVIGVEKTTNGGTVQTTAVYAMTAPLAAGATDTVVTLNYRYTVVRLVNAGGNNVAYTFTFNFTDGTASAPSTQTYSPDRIDQPGTASLTIPAGKVVANLTIVMVAGGPPKAGALDNLTINAGSRARLVTWAEPEQ